MQRRLLFLHPKHAVSHAGAWDGDVFRITRRKRSRTGLYFKKERKCVLTITRVDGGLEIAQGGSPFTFVLGPAVMFCHDARISARVDSGWERCWWFCSATERQETHLMIVCQVWPEWAAMLAGAVRDGLASVAMLEELPRLRAAERGLCPSCGYDLRGGIPVCGLARCPECGRASIAAWCDRVEWMV
ncbi:MAG TPA: hypothetical protein VD971_13930 [Phycisphaerales bacterium]|nr:hypothetical protein [Phycisphaerales bacterium]